MFQDRFKSEPVEDDAYLFTVLRYIHQNPIKAKLCENVEDYRFSSYREYTDNKWIVDTDFILDVMPLEEFAAFNHEENTDKCLEIEEKENIRLTDEQARDIIKMSSGCSNATEFQALPKAEQEKYVEEFKNRGLSIRQVSRLTGVSFGLVRKHY